MGKKMENDDLIIEDAIELIEDGYMDCFVKAYIKKVLNSMSTYQIKNFLRATKKRNPELYKDYYEKAHECEEKSMEIIKEKLMYLNSCLYEGIKVTKEYRRELDELDILLFCRNYIYGYTREQISNILDELIEDYKNGKYEDNRYPLKSFLIREKISKVMGNYQRAPLKSEKSKDLYTIDNNYYIITDEEREYIKKFIQENNLTFDTYTVQLLEERCFKFRELGYNFTDSRLYSPIKRQKIKK